MRRLGLSLDAWLTPFARTVTAAGKPLELALCDDPLEIFQMGAHFETCLSPGGINFFSVLANAADINKRVLYARRDGRVLGRCLLALTDTGGLLAFNPYCHEALHFDQVVAAYARELATSIGAELVPGGPVSTLVARDWYDDGARDLAGRFSAIRDPAKLDLSSIEPAAFAPRLRELLGRPLDDVSLPAVLSLSGIGSRPEVVAALAPDLLACSVSSTRIAAARLAMTADELGLADRLLGDHAAAFPLEDPSWYEGEMIARLRPSLLLARLRATRPRGVRSWRGDSSARLALAGIALEALHRPRQALAMYRLARDANPYARDFIESLLRTLEEKLANDASSPE